VEVKDVIQEFCKERDMITPFKDNHPGRDWMDGFLRRHPSLAPCKTEQLRSVRARAQDPEVVRVWFEMLVREMTQAGVKTLPEQFLTWTKVVSSPILSVMWCWPEEMSSALSRLSGALVETILQ